MNKRAEYLQLARTLLVGAGLLAAIYLTSLYSFLLFHSIVEIFTIVVASGIFMLSWNARDMLDNHYLLFVGIAYLFVAALDLLHTLAFQGMDVFAGRQANLPTQLWVAARYMQSISLLIAPLFLGRRLRTWPVFAAYGLVTVLVVASTFFWRDFPIAYIAGEGLTPFKQISEVAIMLILLAAVGLLLHKRATFSPGVLRLLVLSILAAILSELCFTEYVSVYDQIMIVGHLFRLVSYYLLYKAIIQTGLHRPYQVLFWNLKQSEETLRVQAAELQSRNEELDAFAHSVAHDLQNPLTAILLAAQTARSPKMPPEERLEFLDDIASTARKMSQIIEALMLLAEVRHSQVPIEPVDTGAVISDVKRRLRAQIQQARAEIREPAEWPEALGYAPWVAEVWANYLSNAIQYGGQPPCIELGAELQADGSVRFWVRDNGAGLDPEQQTSLFQVGARLSRKRNGHGLGLSIVKRVVEKLGGQVGVVSRSGQGSQFFFTLPAAVHKDKEWPVGQPALQAGGLN